MRWLLYLIASLLMQIIAWAITPALPLFKQERFGWSNNNSVLRTGWRLPTWLSWFDTPDNDLLGDSRWAVEHSGGYWSMVGWLYRNSLYGLKWTVLSLPEGHPDAWQWHRKYYFQSFYLDLNFGWLLDNVERGRMLFMFSPRIKRIKQ